MSTTETCNKAYTPLIAENSLPLPLPLLLNTPSLDIFLLKRISYIYHPVYFRKNQAKVQILLDSGSEVNVINSAYTAKLYLKVYPTDIRAQKIDGSTLKIFEMVLASFQIKDKLSKAYFF